MWCHAWLQQHRLTFAAGGGPSALAGVGTPRSLQKVGVLASSGSCLEALPLQKLQRRSRQHQVSNPHLGHIRPSPCNQLEWQSNTLTIRRPFRAGPLTRKPRNAIIRVAELKENMGAPYKLNLKTSFKPNIYTLRVGPQKSHLGVIYGPVGPYERLCR